MMAAQVNTGDTLAHCQSRTKPDKLTPKPLSERTTTMPYLNIETNLELSPEQQTGLLKKASTAVAAMLGKPESYVMVGLQQRRQMLFAGSDAPLVYAELKSIGLPQQRTTELSAGLAELFSGEIGVEAGRVYIEFSDAERPMWGWNGGTF